MGKQADRYFQVHPWQIVEHGFDPAHGEMAESVFALGNEYMGLRGYFEEGYSGESLIGSYVGGVYERVMLGRPHYKSMLPFIELMVNTVDWVYLNIHCNGVQLDLAQVNFSDFVRTLDLRSGVLTRFFVWQVDDRVRLKLKFERFLSMVRPQFGAQRLTVEVLAGEAALSLAAGLDFTNPHRSTGQNHWHCQGETANDDFLSILGTTKTTQQRLFAAAHFRGPSSRGTPEVREKFAAMRYDMTVPQGRSITFERLVKLLCGRDYDGASAFEAACAQAGTELKALDYDALKAESAAWWAQQWDASDIEIDGDAENQQGIRYSVFQLHQTLHTADRSAIIGAKGLTGEAYSGNAFWDSEVYCLPFYLLNNPKAARNILQFRYDTLAQAKERARALDLKGAFYPIATISGHECCNLWQHANLQLQPSTGVAYGLWHYVRVTGDTQFLYHQGIEMLVEICRMLDTRGADSPLTGKYGFYCVMGPDEFQMMVNNNTYTNLMAQRTFDYTLAVLEDMERNEKEAYDALVLRTGLNKDECIRWRDKSARMEIRYDETRELFEEHEGFFALPHVDISAIPVEEFPLYNHWAYDRLYRNDMIKQPDVLMFMLMYNTSFTNGQLAANFDYYEPRCIHESSLSPSVHSILATQLGRMEQAYDFFGFATRLDLDNYNRNTREGLHTTALAASWMNIVYGFGGLRTDGETLTIWPCIPPRWEHYSFRVQYRGVVLALKVTKDAAILSADRDDAPEVVLYGRRVRPGREGIRVEIKPRRVIL